MGKKLYILILSLAFCLMVTIAHSANPHLIFINDEQIRQGLSNAQIKTGSNLQNNQIGNWVDLSPRRRLYQSLTCIHRVTVPTKDGKDVPAIFLNVFKRSKERLADKNYSNWSSVAHLIKGHSVKKISQNLYHEGFFNAYLGDANICSVLYDIRPLLCHENVMSCCARVRTENHWKDKGVETFFISLLCKFVFNFTDTNLMVLGVNDGKVLSRQNFIRAGFANASHDEEISLDCGETMIVPIFYPGLDGNLYLSSMEYRRLESQGKLYLTLIEQQRLKREKLVLIDDKQIKNGFDNDQIKMGNNVQNDQVGEWTDLIPQQGCYQSLTRLRKVLIPTKDGKDLPAIFLNVFKRSKEKVSDKDYSSWSSIAYLIYGHNVQSIRQEMYQSGSFDFDLDANAMCSIICDIRPLFCYQNVMSCCVKHVSTQHCWRNKGLATFTLGLVRDFVFSVTSTNLMVADISDTRPWSKRAFVHSGFKETAPNAEMSLDCGETMIVPTFYPGLQGNFYLSLMEYQRQKRTEFVAAVPQIFSTSTVN